MRFNRTILLLLVACCAATSAFAGTISLGWDAVTDTDLVGYRIFWGTSPGVYTQQQDVGIVTTATLTGLTDCTTYYVAVKARDAAGNLSAAYSTELSGYPRPTLTLAAPASAEQGLQQTVVITGSNFQPGAALQFGGSGITASGVTVTSCTQLTATVSVSTTAATGATSVDVTNADHVFGSAAGLFAVVAATPPTVVSVFPASLASSVPISVRPTVTFSEAMKASTITASTVLLLDSTSATVAQAAGSPSLSGDGTVATIVPASALASNRTYRIQVLGGASGVRDLANHALVSTYVQASGFTTVADTAQPSVSAVAASAQATTATITWTTDEPSDSQVFYRKATDVVYQASPIDATLVTSHSQQIQGLAPSTQYHYYVQSADASGNAGTSSPDATFTTGTSSYSYITIEAESGILQSPVRATTGSGAFRGAWIDTPPATPTGTATSPSGRADLGFHVPSNGTWYVWVRMYGTSSATDAWFESIDGATRQQLAPQATGSWKWTAGRSYALAQGLHNLELGGREAQARADRVLITNDPVFVPTEQPTEDTTPPAMAMGLAATPGSGQVTLRWTNPVSDVAAIVVRYRTDGRYPTSPADGLPGITRAATPGAQESFAHTGLANGTSYRYGVFVVDPAGNAAAPAQVQGTPVDSQPPGTVGGAWRTDTH